MEQIREHNHVLEHPAVRIEKYSAWEKFIYDGIITEDVREPVRSSWKRCAQLKVDPFVLSAQRILSSKELRYCKEICKDFIETATPYMDALYQLLAPQRVITFITSNDGVVLQLLGNEEELEQSKRINLVEGAIWTENEIGTNAVGTAIVIEEPVQIIGGEHYCASQHEVTCTAAPIFSGEKLIGVLNVSMQCNKVHAHTLGMVRMAAIAIGNEVTVTERQRTTESEARHLKEVFNSLPKGLVTLNAKGIISYINSCAESLLNVSAAAVIGLPVHQAINSTPALNRVTENGMIMENVEVAVNSSKKVLHYTVNARPLSAKDGTLSGALITFEGKEFHRVATEVAGTRAQLTFHSIIGTSPAILKARELARSAALTNSTVLLLGESGTGKELFAQSIHNGSHRRGPFIAVNCSAIPRTLIESELFGYEAGSFTGSSRNGRPGKFELAHGGSIFLDEIGDMPFDLQTVLLRVLQERTVVRVGGHKPININVRVIAATNKDLIGKVNDGTMREDLYFRLNVVTVNIPPLRDRKEDIPQLIEHLLPQINARMGKKVKAIHSSAQRCLMDYSWPGNIRELENVLERSIVMAPGAVLTANDIPNLHHAINKPGANRVEEILTLAEIEQRALVQALRHTNNISKAAAVLGISRSTIYRKLNDYKISFPDDNLDGAEVNKPLQAQASHVTRHGAKNE